MTAKTTPMMAQWAECKKQAGDAIVFFRLGDFYEALIKMPLQHHKRLISHSQSGKRPLCVVFLGTVATPT